jgi:hypothetical protein
MQGIPKQINSYIHIKKNVLFKSDVDFGLAVPTEHWNTGHFDIDNVTSGVVYLSGTCKFSYKFKQLPRFCRTGRWWP